MSASDTVPGSTVDDALCVTDAVKLERRLQQIAQRLTPCPVPDDVEDWDLCAHGLLATVELFHD